MKHLLLLLFILLLGFSSKAQYFQFSQYNFTKQRINPAAIASSNYAELSFLNRNQSTGGGFHLKSNFVSASYPLISKNGVRWSGFGISLMDDRAGHSGIFITQEVALSYAINIPLSARQTFSLGFKGLHSRRKVDVDGLHTGYQYVPNRGFDERMFNGEHFADLNNSFSTFSAGLYWQKVDKNERSIASFGLSFFDLNKPDDAILKNANPYLSTLVGSLSLRVYNRKKLSLFPEALITMNAGKLSLNAGFITSYDVKSYRKKPSDKIDFITKYRSGEGALVGVQVQNENFSFGASYDFPLFSQKVSNHGALEVGMVLKRLVDPRKKSAKSRKAQARKSEKVSIGKTTAQEPEKIKRDSSAVQSKTNPVGSTIHDLSERLKTKQDSIVASGTPGDITHEALVLEKATLHFNFDFNSTNLDEESEAYLDELARALIDNPDLQIQLIGHTDNVGSSKFNLKLSHTRAQSIKDFLIEKGVEPARIGVSGKGMSEPLNENVTDEERALNRRVEMKIIYGE
jgi:type IX secretion system PorP/SprF family membrane protein